MNSLLVQRVSIDSLAPDPANARLHPEPNLDALTASLRRFQQVEPLVIQAGTRRVIAGHGRLLAMKQLGWKECDVVELEVTNLDATALAIALNRTAELAEWDGRVLAKLLSELREENALDGVGYDPKEIEDLLAEVADLDLGDYEEDVPPEPLDEAVTRRGDIWILGDHRLLCGDSARREDVDWLLAGARIHLVNTDPPYGVRVEPRSNNAIAAGLSSFPGTGHHQALDLARHPEKAKSTTARMRPKDRPLINDFLPEEEFERLLLAWFGNLMVSKRQWAKKADLSTSIGSGTIDTVLTYDKAGLLKTKADPCGCGGSPTTYFTYDAASRLVTIIDALGHRVRRDLKKDGRVTKVSQDEIDGGTTRTYVTDYTYNNDGHLTDISEVGDGDEAALTTTYTVDAKGRVKTLTDPLGNLVAYRKDDFGRVITVLRKMTSTPTYIETRTVYDLNDNVLTKEVEKGGTDGLLRYVYDNADRMITSKDEGNTDHEVYIWDDADNLSLFYDRNGSTVTFTYDKLNQLTRKDYTKANGIEGPSLVKFWYDAVGRIVTAYNQDSRIERKWNTLSKLEQDKVWVMPSAESGTGSTPRDVDYTYDTNGLVATVEYPDDSFLVRRSYDALNRVTKIEKKVSGAWSDLATWAFQGPARMKTLDFANGTKETMSYDLYGRATTMLHDRLVGSLRTNMYEFRRGYDYGSRPTYERRDYFKSSDGSILNGQRDFGDRYYYDAVNRLTKVIRGVGYQTTQSHSLVETAAEDTLNYVTRTEYTFDASGNRQTLLYWDISGGSSRSCRREDHTFDIENQLNTRVETNLITSQSSTKTYSYDNNGSNVSSTDLGSFNVDMENRIYKRGNWYYRYDAFGRRIEKKDSGGSVWFRYYYDDVQCIEEFGTSQGGGDPIEDNDPFWKRIYGPYLVDQILWGEYDGDVNPGTSNAKLYFHPDFLGSVVMLTEDVTSPTIKETYRYDEYGQPYFYGGDGGSPLGLSGYEQDKLYTGRRWDVELSAYNYRERSMNAMLGAFSSRDPIGNNELGNSYTYAHSRPIDRIDPMGLKDTDPCPGKSGEQRQDICDGVARRLGSTVRCEMDYRCYSDLRNSCRAKNNELMRAAAKEMEEDQKGLDAADSDYIGIRDRMRALQNQHRNPETLRNLADQLPGPLRRLPPGSPNMQVTGANPTSAAFSSWFGHASVVGSAASSIWMTANGEVGVERFRIFVDERNFVFRSLPYIVRDAEFAEEAAYQTLKKEQNIYDEHKRDVESRLDAAQGELARQYTSKLEECCKCKDMFVGNIFLMPLEVKYRNFDGVRFHPKKQ